MLVAAFQFPNYLTVHVRKVNPITSLQKLSSFSRKTRNVQKPSISVLINMTISVLIKEVIFARNMNNRKRAELIHFYLAGNNAMSLLSSSRNNVPYSQGTKINTEIEFPDQLSLGPKVLNLTVHFQLYVKTIFILSFRHHLLLCFYSISSFLPPLLTKSCSQVCKAQSGL